MYDGPESFFYLDPPYWGCEDYYGRNIFNREDFTALANLLAGMRGKFLLSLNDTPGVRQTFKDFSFMSLATRYTCAKAKSLPASELLIMNY